MHFNTESFPSKFTIFTVFTLYNNPFCVAMQYMAIYIFDFVMSITDLAHAISIYKTVKHRGIPVDTNLITRAQTVHLDFLECS